MQNAHIHLDSNKMTNSAILFREAARRSVSASVPTPINYYTRFTPPPTLP